MNLTALYNNLYTRSIDDIRNGNNKIDRLIDDKNDKRRGLTVLIRPNDNIQGAIARFQQELMVIDKDQYYQPLPDMHVTVLSIISCYDGFNLEQIETSKYIRLFKQSARNIMDIGLHFQGISASPEAVIIQGFPLSEGLERFRDQLRENFKASALQQTIDARYRLTTAHITAVRFREYIRTPQKFAERLENYRDVDFGSFKPKEVELVYNDWYQKRHIVKTLHKISIK
ncbi:mutarotase [Sphingobacterium corticibacterium]|uniref:Mutarotase n=1 Tax=Sphingobacterium corticibacterium TaxID=2484746 RepID=A0A4Q6XXT0_9SPHI|nr:mutarotase [Sphingobacterium corticibacterium]RZF62234.1 mutarotase [Sphingobacterium corticibacterium]